MNRSETHTLVLYNEDLPTKTALGESRVDGSLPSACASAHINPLAL